MTDCACGQEHGSCTAHKRYSAPGVELPGGPVPCRKPAMKGQKVCASHGGKARQNKRAAAERITMQKAELLVQTYGLKVETTATEALLDEVKWTAGHVQWLREKVSELEEQDLIWGKTREKSGGDDWGSTEEAKPNAFLALYQTERTHLVKVCSEAIRAGIEERRVRLAEQQGALVADVIKRILDDLGLSGEQLAKVSEIVPRHLRLLTA